MLRLTCSVEVLVKLIVSQIMELLVIQFYAFSVIHIVLNVAIFPQTVLPVNKMERMNLIFILLLVLRLVLLNMLSTTQPIHANHALTVIV